MKGNLNQLMQQAQKMQQELAKAQEKLAEMEVTGESGAGLVKVTLNGRYAARRVEIDDSLVGDDKDKLEDLVTAAINDAVGKVESQTRDRMSGLMGGLNIPGLNLGG